MTGRFIVLHVACAGLLLTMAEAGHCENKPGSALLAAERLQQWLHGPARVEVRNEANNVVAAFETKMTPASADAPPSRHTLDALGLSVSERLLPTERGMAWDLTFSGQETSAGHEVTIELPMLAKGQRIFTPSERGIMELVAYPTFTPTAYAHVGNRDAHYYVLPLISVFEPESDTAVTVALPADANIVGLQIDWTDAKTLRLRLAHRRMGGGKPASLRLLFYAHAADYRAVIKTYSDDFPRYFRPTLARGPYEGTFWYHHIQAHPDFEEMARQNVRFIWASFWFTHLGEYMPDAAEWEPYTYAKQWSLKEPMTDAKIKTFIDTMHEHKIGTFAYMNVTEFGGAGGKSGNAEEAERILREQFADALLKDVKDKPIRTWEGAYAMNARRDYSLFPELVEQIRRHVQRLPNLDGFTIDQLVWANRLDYGHDDGVTMDGDRPVESMVGPVAGGVAEVCRQAHAVGWRVYVNQFWRVETLRDVDGYCHETDLVRGLGYLAPLRPASSWHLLKKYDKDLLQFEGQLKRRLQFALFPQMIAHQFPISQQAHNARAADLLELYAPLFATLDGKEQVLLPHCVGASGANDVSLFVNRAGNYVAPVTSRVRFLSRRTTAVEPIHVGLRVPDAAELAWAYVVSADGPPYWATIQHAGEFADITIDRHATSSMVVVGRGERPALPSIDVERLQGVRDGLFPPPDATAVGIGTRPVLTGIESATLLVEGVNLGEPGTVSALVDGKPLGALKDGVNSFALELGKDKQLPANPPRVQLVNGDEGTWFLPERARLLVTEAGGKRSCVAAWTSEDRAQSAEGVNSMILPLAWRPIGEVPVASEEKK